MKYCDSADAQQRGVELRLQRAVLRFEIEQRDFHGPALYLKAAQPRLVTRVGCGALVL